MLSVAVGGMKGIAMKVHEASLSSDLQGSILKPVEQTGWLASAGTNATSIHHPNAGHRLLFPSGTTPRSIEHAHDGSDEADAELGRSAWDAIAALLWQ
jgi:hypothetical protein